MSQKNPGVAAVLSFIFSGVGQIYNGEIKKGLFFVFLTTVGLVLALLGTLAIILGVYYGFLTLKFILVSMAFLGSGGIIICWVGIHSIYDAYKNAQ